MRIIIPFTAGSQTDVLARLIGAKLAETSGHQVVSDNRPGAGGIVAGNIVAGAKPDGQTILLTSIAYAVSAALYTKLPYDPLKDIVGVGQIASTPLILVVNPNIGVKSVKDLIALAKAKPGADRCSAPPASAAAPTWAASMFKFAAGINVVHIPYKGTPEALVDTAAGRVQYWLSPTGPAMAFVKDGRVLALGVTTAQALSRVSGRADDRGIRAARVRLRHVVRRYSRRARRRAPSSGRSTRPFPASSICRSSRRTCWSRAWS